MMDTNSWDWRIALIDQLGVAIAEGATIYLGMDIRYTKISLPIYVQWSYSTGRSGAIERSPSRMDCDNYAHLLVGDMMWFGDWLHQIGSGDAPEYQYAICQARTPTHVLTLWMDASGIIWIADPDLAAREGQSQLIRSLDFEASEVREIWI